MIVLRALVLTACAVLLLIAAPVLLPHRPGEAYPAFLGVVAAAALWLGRRAAYWALGACTVLMARFLLQGEGFSVTDPAEALGLIVLTLVGLFLVTVIGRLRGRLTAAEAALAAARAERDGKAALLAEIAHRIANDVGSLAAMARLQANGATDEDPRAILQGFAARVEVFGSLYRRLNLEPSAAGTIEMVEFLGDLCDELRAAHLGLRPIVLDFAGEPCRMSPARATKVALVLNEAVMNALKYAFPDDRPGRIAVAFGPDPGVPGGLHLTVSDDGVGPDAAEPRGSGLGQRLLTAMAAQLKGGYALERAGGKTLARLHIGSP